MQEHKLHPPATTHQLNWWQRTSQLRARVWGLFLAFFTDGVTSLTPQGPVPLARKPKLPAGPLIVVANHSSHADSAVLAATLGRSRPVLFAAGADYWLKNKVAEWAGRSLIGLWPVRRGGHGWDDLEEASQPVSEGLVLVIYPEGTRTRDGQLGDFHKGAFRLAQLAGAQVLPVGIKGTRDALPVHGRLHRTDIELRWGTPITVGDGQESVALAAQDARTQIDALVSQPLTGHDGFGWARVRRMALSLFGLAFVFTWALAEGISWPLIAEMPLLLLIVTVGFAWRAPLLIVATAVGSVLGIFATWWMVKNGIHPPTPLTTPRMWDVALADIQSNPTLAFWHQTYSGIPVKVYASSAAAAGLDAGELALAMWPRIARIFVVGAARYLKPSLGAIQAASLIAFPILLALVIAWWS